ncbi:MAG TPA: OPT family oligopeptide transporter [Polyangiaceae bacterium]|nr:OPT family oligopeptide transporter [Polyangiaceae bacterium]
MTPAPPPTAEPRQLTARAVVAGMAIGAVLCASNVYVVLKTGWSLGVTLSSTIIAFGLFRALRAARLVRHPLGVLENTTVSSVASAAAFMTGGGNMAALPALVMLTGQRPAAAALALWFGAIAALGVFAAIPIKRRILDTEGVPFPLGVATATTLRAMHGTPDGGRTAGKLYAAAAAAGVFTLLRDLRSLPAHIPAALGLPFSIAGHPARAWSFGLDASLVLVGGGALMGPRTAWSMLLGAVATYGVLAPALVQGGAIAAVDYKAIVAFTAWPGAAMLVSASVTSLAFQWRGAFETLRSLVSLRPPAAARSEDEAADEAPSRWFALGVAALAPLVVWMLARFFGVPVWAGLLSIPLALVMGVVAGRVTGETDISPTKALGPVTQLIYGALLPANLTANLMSANVTGGVGLHTGDLLTDLKVGQLVGASPRRQVIAQLFGVAVGALAVVPAFALLVPDAAALGTPELPAPAVMVWASVSKALAGGLAGLPHAVRVAIAIGGALGAGLAALERWLPARLQPWVPSAAGMGMAMVIPASTSIAMFAGSLMASGVRRARPAAAASLVPIASGLVAGESVVGMALAVGRALGG